MVRACKWIRVGEHKRHKKGKLTTLGIFEFATWDSRPLGICEGNLSLPKDGPPVPPLLLPILPPAADEVRPFISEGGTDEGGPFDEKLCTCNKRYNSLLAFILKQSNNLKKKNNEREGVRER